METGIIKKRSLWGGKPARRLRVHGGKTSAYSISKERLEKERIALPQSQLRVSREKGGVEPPFKGRSLRCVEGGQIGGAGPCGEKKDPRLLLKVNSC